MHFTRFKLCDNIRMIELAAKLTNESADMDLAIFLDGAILEHLHDEHDCILELGDFAEIRLCPKDGEVELSTRNGAAVMSDYLFYGIKDWSLGKVTHISNEFAEAIDKDLHRDPNEDGIECEVDFGER